MLRYIIVWQIQPHLLKRRQILLLLAMTKKFVGKLLILLAFTSVALAQDPEVDDTPITVGTTVVRLNVGVVDRTGAPIKNLEKQDFVIYEDGKAQDISDFEPTVAPFSVVLILDMSGSTIGFRQTIRTSALRFIGALDPQDRVSVIECYDKVNVLNGFTSNRETLYHSIDVANGRGKTRLYDSLEIALKKLKSESNRRKAIIVLTDGIDTKAQNSDRTALASLNDSAMKDAIPPLEYDPLKKVLQDAQEIGATIYPLALPTGDPRKLADPLPIQLEMYGAARERLNILARRTGGTMTTINRLEEMGRLYAEIAADVRSLYTIEYQPINEKRDGKWREVKIEVKRPELISRTRPGYYAN